MNLDRKILDEHLKNALVHLFEHWDDPKMSVVAAALVDGDKVIYAATDKTDEGKRKHAERNALEQFKKKYGKPSADAVMVVTLSPCFTHSSTREGGACSEMLKEEGIKNIYIGAMDKLQQHSIKNYEDMGLQAQVCKNPTLAKCCYMLEDMFERHKEDRERGKSWVEVKHAIKKDLCPKSFFYQKIMSQVSKE